MWALLQDSGISKITTQTSSCIYFLFKLVSLQYKKRKSWKKGAQSYIHIAQILKNLPIMHQKNCKTNAQKDKELNLRMQKLKLKLKKCTKDKYKELKKTHKYFF